MSEINTKDTMSDPTEWETCAVCGDPVEPGHGAARINHRGDTVNLCSPGCLQTFAHEPDPYIARLAKTLLDRELSAGCGRAFASIVVPPPAPQMACLRKGQPDATNSTT